MQRRNKHPGTLVLGLFFALAISGCTSILAQDAGKANRVETNLVLIDVLVTDRKGQIINGLTADSFELTIDGRRQVIDNFLVGAAPVSFGVVFDMHPTTADRNRMVIEALREFRRELMPADELFVMAFNDRGQQTFDFVPTLEQLDTFMSSPSLREPHSLYDAIYFAADKLRSAPNMKRSLIVISDTADHDSRRYIDEAQMNVQSVKAEVFALITEDPDRYGYRDLMHTSRDIVVEARDATPLDRAAVDNMASKSGGGTITISQNAYRMLAVCKQIAGDMRAHYTLGSYMGTVDGSEHKVRVKINGAVKDAVLSYRPVF